MKTIIMLYLSLGTLMAQSVPSSREKEARTFVERLVDRVAPLSKDAARTYWEATATGKKETYARQAGLEIKIRKVYAHRDGYEKARGLKDDSSIQDPLLRRQLTLLYLNFLENQIDPKLMEEMVKLSSSIEASFNTHRSVFEGQKVSDNILADVLKKEPDVGRRKAAWEASKTVGQAVAPELIRLVKLRNQAARDLGFQNYYVMRMTLNEQDADEILALFDKLAAATDEAFAAVKERIDAHLAAQYKIAPEELRPYHYQDFFFQEVQDIGGVNMDDFLSRQDVRILVEKFYNGMGLPVSAFLKRSDLYEREGKYQHAYCIDIDRKGDARTMCSLRNNRYWLETLLHETGHGVYAMNIDKDLPWLLREEAHTFTTEAIAEMFGSLQTNPRWLAEAAGIPAETASSWAPMLELERKMGLLLFCRWSEVMIHFERAMYEDPDQDLNRIWWDLVEKYQRLRRIEGRDRPDWAAKIHLTTSPVYYHNYMLGNLLACQLLNYMNINIINGPDSSAVTFVQMPALGAYLREKIFKPGKTLRWDALIQQATGEPLNPEHFARAVRLAARPD